MAVIRPQEQETEGYEERGFDPILPLDRLDQGETEKQDEDCESGVFHLFCTCWPLAYAKLDARSSRPFRVLGRNDCLNLKPKAGSDSQDTT
jgi:hypothetical protein